MSDSLTSYSNIIYGILLSLHILAAVIWVGGMFFAYIVLRPAVGMLEPAHRLQLWAGTFERFFLWVWAAVFILWATGLWMILGYYGGFGNVRIYVHLMLTIALIMSALFWYVFFYPYMLLKKEVEKADYPAAAKHLARIRPIIAINLLLGLCNVCIAAAGRIIA